MLVYNKQFIIQYALYEHTNKCIQFGVLINNINRLFPRSANTAQKITINLCIPLHGWH